MLIQLSIVDSVRIAPSTGPLSVLSHPSTSSFHNITCFLRGSSWVFSSAPFTFPFFLFSTGVWTQGLHLDPLHQPFFVMGWVLFCFVFWDRVMQTISPVWLRTEILLISASWIARIYRREPPALILMGSFLNDSVVFLFVKHPIFRMHFLNLTSLCFLFVSLAAALLERCVYIHVAFPLPYPWSKNQLLLKLLLGTG
jgi:hypothetical protein